MCIERLENLFTPRYRHHSSDSHPIFQSVPSTDSLNVGSRSSTERMGRELSYFFMNPCQKYKAKKRIAWKLLIQMIKIALVTAQIIIYGKVNQDFTIYKDSNQDSIRHFLFDTIRNETKISQRDDLYLFVNTLRKQYVGMPNNSIGLYEMIPIDEDKCSSHAQVQACYTGFNKTNNHYQLSSTYEECHILKEYVPKEELSKTDVPLCNGSKLQFDFVGLINLDLSFIYRTRWLESGINHYHGRCFHIKSRMRLANHAHSGLLIEDLTSEFYLVACDGDPASHEDDGGREEVGLITLDVAITLLCLASTALCSRSIYRANRLRISFEKFYLRRYGRALNFWHKFEFVNLWHFLIIVSDLMTTTGTLLKIANIYFLKTGELIDLSTCSIFLGLGCLCIWIGVLRYVGYFHDYNKLVMTMKKAIPSVARFMVCASILYFAYMFAGWLVLGPFHRKFRSLVVTSETLFSLINGDDMYMTYEEMNKVNTPVWIFSQVFLYSFISLFIYFILALFIAVIEDIYEMIKDWEREGQPAQSEVEKVMEEICSDAHNHFDDFLHSDTYCFFCCYHNNDPDIDSDSEVFLPATVSGANNNMTTASSCNHGDHRDDADQVMTSS